MKTIPLSELMLHQAAVIGEINCGDVLSSRLANMGLRKGTRITPLFHSEVAIAARKLNLSLNGFVEKSLKDEMASMAL